MELVRSQIVAPVSSVQCVVWPAQPIYSFLRSCILAVCCETNLTSDNFRNADKEIVCCRSTPTLAEEEWTGLRKYRLAAGNKVSSRISIHHSFQYTGGLLTDNGKAHLSGPLCSTKQERAVCPRAPAKSNQVEISLEPYPDEWWASP